MNKKLDHVKGGKILELVLVLLAIALVAVVILLFKSKSIGFIAGIMILVTTGSIIWLVYKYYKPAFTEITFYKDSIVSKTHFESEELSVKNIKGIWFITHPKSEEVYTFSPNNFPTKGSLVLIGDIDYFNDAEYVGLNGITALCDSFSEGYTTLYYRKELDDILMYYFNKINSR